MKTGIALFCIFGLGLIFDYWKVGNDPEFHKLIPFSKHEFTCQYYTWAVLEKIGFLTVIFLWYKEATGYSKPFVLVFLFFMIGDFVDFMLSYSELKYFGLTYNMWFSILYGFFLIYKAWEHR